MRDGTAIRTNRERFRAKRLGRLRGGAGVFEFLHRLGAVVFWKYGVRRIGRDRPVAIIDERLDVERDRTLPHLASIDLMARHGALEIGLKFVHRGGAELDVRYIGRCDYRSEKQGGKHGDRPL